MTAPPHGTADEYERQQQDEWHRYRAKVPIAFFGQRAYNPGDPVPISAVDGDAAWIDRQWVDTVDAEQGQTFQGSATVVSPEPPAIDPAAVAAPPGSATADPNTITEEG